MKKTNYYTRKTLIIVSIFTAVLLVIYSCSKCEDTYYTVTFDSTGGSSVESQRVIKGGMATEPEHPVKTDSLFYYWYLESDTSHFDFSTLITADITLKARWFHINIGINSDSSIWKTESIDGGVRIVEYLGSDTELIIPTLINDKKVLQINKFLTSGIANYSIIGSSSELPNSTIVKVDFSKAFYLDSINNGAFRNCEGVTEIILPFRLKYIDKIAFYHTNVTSINLPKSLKRIGVDAFTGNSGLVELRVTRNLHDLTKLSDESFENTPIETGANDAKIYYPTGTKYPTEHLWKDLNAKFIAE